MQFMQKNTEEKVRLGNKVRDRARKEDELYIFFGNTLEESHIHKLLGGQALTMNKHPVVIVCFQGPITEGV